MTEPETTPETPIRTRTFTLEFQGAAPISPQGLFLIFKISNTCWGPEEFDAFSKLIFNDTPQKPEAEEDSGAVVRGPSLLEGWRGYVMAALRSDTETSAAARIKEAVRIADELALIEEGRCWGLGATRIKGIAAELMEADEGRQGLEAADRPCEAPVPVATLQPLLEAILSWMVNSNPDTSEIIDAAGDWISEGCPGLDHHAPRLAPATAARRKA